MDSAGALEKVVAALPGGGEPRPGQVRMAEAVERAIGSRRHLIVQAGTGTGKSLGYLVPAILSGKRIVVATATKALQDQLVGKDLPFLADQLPAPFTFAALKGRSNYLCLQRAKEALADQEQLALDGVGVVARAQVLKLVEWATKSETGDRSDLLFEPAAAAWSAVSVSSRECPGPHDCPIGFACFAERAKAKGADADVLVVNTHLYGVHLASGGVVLPEHDVVVVDEAHQLEDIISATAGFELSRGTFIHLARLVRNLITDPRLSGDIDATGGQLADVLGEYRDRRIRQPGEALGPVLDVARGRVEQAMTAVRGVSSTSGDVPARKQRALMAATTVASELAALSSLRPTDVAWVEGPAHALRLRVAPIDVAEALSGLWANATVVLTSATIPVALAGRLGMPPDEVDELDVGSPFDFGQHALLYCAAHLPDPRSERYEAAMHDELAALIAAAGGRTLALFTSWRAMEAAVAELRPRLNVPVLAQNDLPKPRLVEAFATDESACLFATMGFWQGVDLPGRTLSLVTVDRLPFPRPDEPLLQARRERARAAAFATIDLPKATTLLAQGAGRLIRTATDRGVVAVLDPRLAKANYRWAVINRLPPMRRTKDRAEVEAFLREVTGLG